MKLSTPFTKLLSLAAPVLVRVPPWRKSRTFSMKRVIEYYVSLKSQLWSYWQEVWFLCPSSIVKKGLNSRLYWSDSKCTLKTISQNWQKWVINLLLSYVTEEQLIPMPISPRRNSRLFLMNKDGLMWHLEIGGMTVSSFWVLLPMELSNSTPLRIMLPDLKALS